MRTKEAIINDLTEHAQMLDPNHLHLAAVAMIETEVQIDIRDMLELRFCQFIDRVAAISEKD